MSSLAQCSMLTKHIKNFVNSAWNMNNHNNNDGQAATIILVEQKSDGNSELHIVNNDGIRNNGNNGGVVNDVLYMGAYVLYPSSNWWVIPPLEAQEWNQDKLLQHYYPSIAIQIPLAVEDFVEYANGNRGSWIL